MVLLGTVTAASACYYTNIDVKPDSWPNPINLKDKGVVTVAVDGNTIETFYDDYYGFDKDKTSTDALNDFQVIGVYLIEKDYVFAVNDFDAFLNDPELDKVGPIYKLNYEGEPRLVLENVNIAPEGNLIEYDDDKADLLIKLKNLDYYNTADLQDNGEYQLAVLIQVKSIQENGIPYRFVTAPDIVTIMY